MERRTSVWFQNHNILSQYSFHHTFKDVTMTTNRNDFFESSCITALTPLTPRKGKQLITKLKSKEMYEEDEDFPKDEDDSQQILAVFSCAPNAI